MHQPYYRDLATGECSMPWVRLHGTKDYLDMVKRLEAYPSIHQTVNVVPSLLDQLEEYLPPHNQSDHFLDLSRKPALELTEHEQRFVLSWFFMANWETMIPHHPRYGDLLAKRGLDLRESDWPDILKRFKPQDYLDLQVWFNLVWIDPWLRQQDPLLTSLETKGHRFTEEEKCQVLHKQLELMQQIVPTYRAAQDRGQVELTTSAYYHPILPLLCDLKSAHEALPNLPLPNEQFRHPDDAAWHLSHALTRHEQAFGRRPQGLWPPEGSVSEEMARLCITHRLRWIATDEELLWRTLRTSPTPVLRYRPHRLARPDGQLALVLRDRELSDLIGFTYSRWDPQLAARDLMQRLDRIRQSLRDEPHPALVSIILDGENAWESYPGDGHEFLSAVYAALTADERFRTVTVGEFLDRYPLDQTPSLPTLAAGSWIDGNFATWIGHREKNDAWVKLAETRAALADVDPQRHSPEQRERAWRSFYVAEGSDWMWWFGDTHSSAQDAEFDRLFRLHLSNVYRFLEQAIPPSLDVPIKRVGGYAVLHPTGPVHPKIDGLETTYYEWLYAGRIDLRKGYTTAHRGSQCLLGLWYGFETTHSYWRIDLDADTLKQLGQWEIRVDLLDRGLVVQLTGEREALKRAVLQRQDGQTEEIHAVYARILEMAIPLAALGIHPSETVELRLTLLEQGEPREQHPVHGVYHVLIPPEEFESQLWSV